VLRRFAGEGARGFERLPDDANEAKPVLVELRAAGTLALPGAVGTEFSGWSKSKRALDKAIIDARARRSRDGNAI
jgi:hypothetical protein